MPKIAKRLGLYWFQYPEKPLFCQNSLLVLPMLGISTVLQKKDDLVSICRKNMFNFQLEEPLWNWKLYVCAEAGCLETDVAEPFREVFTGKWKEASEPCGIFQYRKHDKASHNQRCYMASKIQSWFEISAECFKGMTRDSCNQIAPCRNKRNSRNKTEKKHSLTALFTGWKLVKIWRSRITLHQTDSQPAPLVLSHQELLQINLYRYPLQIVWVHRASGAGLSYLQCRLLWFPSRLVELRAESHGTVSKCLPCWGAMSQLSPSAEPFSNLPGSSSLMLLVDAIPC